MTARFEKTGSILADSAPVSRAAPPIDERADCPAIAQRDPHDRKLRNCIVLANMIAWIVIIVFVRYVFCG
jgi:hypothetical protein